MLVEHIDKNGGIVTSNQGGIWPVWQYYMAREYEEAPVVIRKSIQLDSKEQGDYIVYDWLYYYRPETYDISKDSLTEIDPVVSLDNHYNLSWQVPAKFFSRRDAYIQKYYPQVLETDFYDRYEIYDLRNKR